MPGKSTSPIELREQVYLRLREAIDAGTFAPGARLPATREQAGVLGVSRNTVLWAVGRLQAEGYLVGRVGDGTYVTERRAAPGRAPRSPGPAAQQWLSQRGRLIAETGLRWNPATGEALPFRIGRPALEEFPFALWQRLERRTPIAARIAGAGYAHPAGHLPLRAAIAQWLLVSRGIRCVAGQVLITAGSQQALDLVARLLLDVGDEVLVEDPGYPQYSSLNDFYCLVDVDWRQGLGATRAKRKVAHLSFDASWIAPTASAGYALLQDLLQDALMKGFPLHRGE
jgi:GntR family transcriptional regulator/MocR family aminotransferase